MISSLDRQTRFPKTRGSTSYETDIKRETASLSIFREDSRIGSRGVSSLVDTIHYRHKLFAENNTLQHNIINTKFLRPPH